MIITDEIEKVYYSVTEVAELIHENNSTVRYWHDVFGVGARLGKVHRLYTREQVAKMHLIKQLLRVEKYTIEGAKRRLLDESK